MPVVLVGADGHFALRGFPTRYDDGVGPDPHSGKPGHEDGEQREMSRSGKLRAEDVPVFERLVQQALDSQEMRNAADEATGATDTGRLYSLATQERMAIARTASAEYERYVRARSAARRSAAAKGRRQGAGSSERAHGGLAALAVLIPALTAAAAAVLLPLGYGLAVVRPSLADGLQDWGWICAGVAAIGALAGLVRILVAAVRNRPTQPASAHSDDPKTAEAQEVWQQALLDRGILPYLRRQLEAAGSASRARGPSSPSRTDADATGPGSAPAG